MFSYVFSSISFISAFYTTFSLHKLFKYCSVGGFMKAGNCTLVVMLGLYLNKYDLSNLHTKFKQSKLLSCDVAQNVP